MHSQAFAAGAIIYKLLGCQQEWSHCLIIEHSAPPDKEGRVRQKISFYNFCKLTREGNRIGRAIYDLLL